MPVITGLPQELLEEVFYDLGSIDDVHHLARSFKAASLVIGRKKAYVNIMRTVISNAPQHRYDLQLCEMLNLHRDMANHFKQRGPQPVPTQPNPQSSAWPTLNIWEQRLKTATKPKSWDNTASMPDLQVYEILTRWQGLRVLEKLWLERQLKLDDFLTAKHVLRDYEISDGYHILQNRNEDFRDGIIAARNFTTAATNTYTSFNADHRGRLHAAVTYIWILNEVRWTLTQFVWPSENIIHIALLDDIKQGLESQVHTPLLDDLDRYATYQFLYHHLLPLHSPFLADRASGKLPFTFTTNFSPDPILPTLYLQVFLTASQAYLQPPDILELAIRSRTSRGRPWPRMEFPKSWETWIRPYIPRNLEIRGSLMLLDDPMATRHFIERTYQILNRIVCCSIHQTRHRTADLLPIPRAGTRDLHFIKEYFDQYLAERVCVQFDLHANPNCKNDFMEEFQNAWPRIRWMIWWWANGEDKARAKLERIRERYI